MNKRLLSRIEKPKASENLISLAKRTDRDKYIATAKIVDVNGEKILLLNFFQRSELRKEKTGAAFRTFISRSDYITQDLSSTRVKWKTGSFKSILGWYWWNTNKKGHNVIFASDSDFTSAKYFMKAYLEGEVPNVWDAIWKFQDEVLDRRLKTKHKKETDKIDKKMEMVPEKPEGFEKWVHEVAMGDKRYLVYEAASKKKMTTGYCIYCKRAVGIDAKSIRPRNKKRGTCPNSGSPVTFIPKGYFPIYQRDNKWVCLMQKVSTGIVARYFHVHQEIQRDNNYKKSFNISELCRAFLEETNNGEPKIDAYEWGVYKQHGLPRWCPDQNHQNCARAVVYTENLQEVFKGTFYRYCALDLYQKKFACDPIPVWRFMNKYPRYTYLEMFLKTGLVNLTGEIVEGNAYHLDLDGKTPEAILGISKKYISILREIDGGTDELRLLKQCESDNILPQGEDIRGFCERFGGDDELIGVINAHMGIQKFNKYMDKQRVALPKHKEIPCHAAWCSPKSYSKKERMREGYRNLAKDWLDYIAWSATLNYDTKDMYVLLPPDFGKTHDRVMKEYQAFKDEQERKRQKELEKLIKKALNEAEGIPAMKMKARGLMVILPKSGSEIKEEGKTLHHCVGTYVERVAKGETMILFVRKEAAPDVPYFTLEYKDGKVVQCRGKNNCEMTKDVKAFVKAFEQKMKEENGKENSVKERRAG